MACWFVVNFSTLCTVNFTLCVRAQKWINCYRAYVSAMFCVYVMASAGELPISANSFSYGFLYTQTHTQHNCQTHVYRNDSGNASFRLFVQLSNRKCHSLFGSIVIVYNGKLGIFVCLFSVLLLCFALLQVRYIATYTSLCEMCISRYKMNTCISAVYGNCERRVLSSAALAATT